MNACRYEECLDMKSVLTLRERRYYSKTNQDLIKSYECALS